MSAGGNKMDKVSVIIPVYNSEKYLDFCIRSVCSQSYSNLEILLIDDGSTDSGPDICDNYAEKDPRIKVIHKENGGLSDARNTGISESTGAFLFFVDSDDAIHSHLIEALVNILLSRDSDIAACNYQLFRNNGQISALPLRTGNVTDFNPREFMLHYFDREKYQHSVVVSWGKLYKRELWDNIWFPKGKIHEDEYTTYKLIYRCRKISYLNAQGYFYRKNDIGIQRSSSAEKHLDAAGAYHAYFDFFHSDPEIYQKMIKAYLNFLISLGWLSCEKPARKTITAEYLTYFGRFLFTCPHSFSELSFYTKKLLRLLQKYICTLT